VVVWRYVRRICVILLLIKVYWTNARIVTASTFWRDDYCYLLTLHLFGFYLSK